jgi:hypothetical protein
VSTVRDPLDDLRKIKMKKGRDAWMQRFLGPNTKDRSLMQHRAVIVTRAREEKLWPK